MYSNRVGFGEEKAHLLGITLGVASGFFYALLIVLYRTIPNPNRGVTISVVNFWRYLMSTVLLLPLLPLITYSAFTAQDLVPLARFGLAFAVIASGIHNFGISRTRSLHVSILGKSEPVFATAYAWMFLRETPSLPTIIGGVLIIGSSLWLAFDKDS